MNMTEELLSECMEFDHTPSSCDLSPGSYDHSTGSIDASPSSSYMASPQSQGYDEDDRQEIINLIRSLESQDPEEPQTYSNDILFDDKQISKMYTDDFDALFSLS